jgi:hypothetical protein
MQEKIRCQSCSMPMSEAFGNYGTMADGTTNAEYCIFCFRDGTFTHPEQTLDEMIRRSIEIMTSDLGMPIAKATELSNAVIPNLKRWHE